MERRGIQFCTQDFSPLRVPNEWTAFVLQISRHPDQIPGSVRELKHALCDPIFKRELRIPWTFHDAPIDIKKRKLFENRKGEVGARRLLTQDIVKQEGGFTESKAVTQFLHGLQELRSTGSGHRKGSGYEEKMAGLGLDVERKPDAVARLLEEAIAALRAIRFHFIEGGANE